MNIIARALTLGLLLNTAQLDSMALFSSKAKKSSSWSSWFTTKTVIGGAVVIGAAIALYYYLKPVPTETLKANAEACFVDARNRYTGWQGQSNDELVLRLKGMGRRRQLGFWESFWYGQRDHLGEECRGMAPLLRGVELIKYDVAQLRKHQTTLAQRFGSPEEASRQVTNYDNMSRLSHALGQLITQITTSQKYSDEVDTFNRHIRILEEQQRTRDAVEDSKRKLDRIERKIDRQNRP